MDHSLRAAPLAHSNSADGELKQQVEAELARLDEKLRLPVSLHYEHGLSYEDAAAVLGLSPGTLRVYASQGIQELREKLGASGRAVSAEILLALLGTGLALKASPALASSVAVIVAKSAAAGMAAGAAKAAGSGKPMVFVAGAGKGGTGLAFGIAALVSVALVGAAAAFLWRAIAPPITVAAHSYAPQAAPAETPDNPRVVEPVAKASVAGQATPMEPIDAPLESRVIQTKFITPASPTWPAFEQAVNAARSPQGTFIYEWQFNAVFLRLKETPEGFARIQPVIDQYDVAGTDFIPDAAIEKTWAAADDLIPLIDLERDSVAGDWKIKGGNLIGQPGSFSRVAVPYMPPEEYDFRIDFTRTAGSSDVNMIFPAGGAQQIWRMESWQSCYFGAMKDNPDVVPLRISNGVRHTAVVEVRRGKLSAYFDGKLLKSIVIGKSPSLSQPDFRLPDPREIGVGTWRNGIVFHRVAVRAVTGKGAPLPPDPDAANVGSEDYWKDALDMMPKAFSSRNALGGKWRLENNALVADAAPFSRFQIDYAPPEEYDLRAVFTRIDGKGEFAQIVAAANTQFIWKIDSSGMCILDSIGEAGAPWDGNPSFIHAPGLVTNGTPHVAVVSIRKTGVKAYLDGRLLAMHATNYSDMFIENIWRLKAGNAIGVGFQNSKGIVSKLQVKEVTGKGHALEPQKDAEEQNGAF